MDTTITLREATRGDGPRLFAWRNDPATRAASLTPDVVTRDDHDAWMEKTLASSARTLWIAERGVSAIGTVRLDVTPDRQELSWTVAPEGRGKGYGKAMVLAALERTSGPVRARIRPENKASQAIARACGFTRVFTQGGVETWLFRVS